MARRYALRDDQWDRIKDLLPGRAGTVGVTGKDNRLLSTLCCIAIAPAYRGAICRSASVISEWCIRVSAAGRRAASGRGFSRIWRKTPTMNTR